jgi:putative transposase
MPTFRPQQRYDHRLRDLVQRTGDLSLATAHGVPRSTARGWLGAAPLVVVSLEGADLTEPELRQEILKLRRRVEKLAALLRLALALLYASGFRCSGARVPDGDDKRRILRAVDQARACMPLPAVLRFLGVSPSRFQAWRRGRNACALDDQSSCPRTSPHRLTRAEVQAIGHMVTSPEYRHVPTGTLAILAQRLGTVSASPSTWYGLVRKYGWRRPRLRVHPAKPKVGLRTTALDEMWHIDTTVIRLLDGTRACVHAVIDNFSRRILAWRVADRSAAVNSVTVLLEAIERATRSAPAPVVSADAGVENVNAQVDALIETGVLRCLLAFTELKFSNSMIEAWSARLQFSGKCHCVSADTPTISSCLKFQPDSLRPQPCARERCMSRQGSHVTKTVRIYEGPGRVQIKVNDLIALGVTEHSTTISAVYVSNGAPAPVAAERTMYWGADLRDGHSTPGVAAPLTNWYFGEGARGGLYTSYIPISNPTGSPADVWVTFYNESGVQSASEQWIPAFSRATFQAPGGFGGFGFTVTSANSVPVVAERVMYWDADGVTWAGGTGGVGSPSLATHWVATEGSMNGFFHTYVLIGNANGTTASVRVAFRRPDGTFLPINISIPPHTRYTVDTILYMTGDFATDVISSVPVVVERSMYWAGSDFYGGSNTLARIRQRGSVIVRFGGSVHATTYKTAKHSHVMALSPRAPISCPVGGGMSAPAVPDIGTGPEGRRDGRITVRCQGRAVQLLRRGQRPGHGGSFHRVDSRRRYARRDAASDAAPERRWMGSVLAQLGLGRTQQRRV